MEHCTTTADVQDQNQMGMFAFEWETHTDTPINVIIRLEQLNEPVAQ